MTEDDTEARIERFGTAIDAVRNEVGKVVVGQREVLDGVLICLLTGGHALLEGVPGLGKTVLVRALAAALDLEFARIQFTPDLMPADIVGTTLIAEDEHGHRSFTFQPGPVFAHVVLADEINRATPKTQSALLEAMQEQAVTVAKVTRPLEQPFVVLATQNPLEMEGTYPLPEAQLDRFLLKLHVPFPARDEIHEILDRTTGTAAPEVRPVLTREQVIELRAVVRDVAVARHVQDFAVRLVEATHPDREGAPELVSRFVRYGASPRGAQALLVAAKARALFRGQPHVATDDVRAMLAPALRHRLILNFEGEAEGITTDRIIEAVVEAVPEVTK